MPDLTALSQALSAVAGATLLGLASHTYARREKPVATSLAVLFGTLGATALCTAVTAHSGTPYKLIWLYTSLGIPLALAFFSFDYYGLRYFSSGKRAAATVTPAVLGGVGGTAVVLGTPAMSPGSAPPVAGLAVLPGVAFEVAGTLHEVGFYYTTAVMLVAVGLVVRNVVRYAHLDTRLGAVIAFVGVWPWLANLVVPQVAAVVGPEVGLLAVAVGYAGSSLVAVLVVDPLELFASSPAAGNVGPETVLDSMDDAVLMVDDHEQILRLNAVARRTFECSETGVVGRPLEEVLGRSLDALAGDETVPIQTADGTRQFAVTRSPVADRAGERGHVVVLRDVTQRLTREQRLEVLNRVLRHNLRNDATNIIGRAQLISDGRDPEASAEEIIDTTRDLVGAAERAREIENMMSATGEGVTTSLRSSVENVARDVDRDYPEVAVTTAVPDGAVADVDSSTFETVLHNVVENAAEHNDADDPIVVVSADDTEAGSLELAVADNGPGIPEHERAVLDAGQEDQLQHGSGLGLWAAHWGVTQMGGELSISENDPRGSVVTVTVPAAPDASDAGGQERATAD